MVFKSFARFFDGFWDSNRKTRRKPNKTAFAARRRPLMEVLEDRLAPATMAAPVVQNTYPFLSPTSATLNSGYNPQVAVDPLNPNNIAVVANENLGGNSPDAALLFAISNDGGTSWTVTDIPNTTTDPDSPANNPFIYAQVSDPSITIDRGGTIYVLAHEHDPNLQSGAFILHRFSLNGAAVFADVTVHNWYRGPAGSASEDVGDSAYSPVIAIDNNEPIYTDPQTGMVQIDSLATMHPSPTTPGLMVPKAVFIGWTARDVATAAQAPRNGPIGHAKMVVSSDGGNSFSTMEDFSFGTGTNENIVTRNSARPTFFFTQGSPQDPNSPFSFARVQGGLLGVVYDDFGSGQRGLLSDVTLPDGGNPAAGVGTTIVGIGTGGVILDAGPVPTQPNVTQFDTPSVTTFDLPIDITDPRFTTIADVEVTFSLTHPHLNQLRIELIAPDGTAVTLMQNRNNPNGTTNMIGNAPAGLPDIPNLGFVNGRPLGTTFKNSTTTNYRRLNATAGSFLPAAPYVGTYIPEIGSLALLQGMSAATASGTWKLRFTDFLFDGIDPQPVQNIANWKLTLTSNLSTTGFQATDTRFVLPTLANVAANAPRVQQGDFTTPYPLNGGIYGGTGVGPGVSIAVDNTLGSFSPFQGRVYVAFLAVDGNIYMEYADSVSDSFAFFSPLTGVPLNDDTSADNFSEGNRAQFMPTVAVDQSTGTFVAMWYDGRNDPAKARVTNYITTSSDGGFTYSPQVPINVMNVAKDALTGEVINVEPIPSNLALHGVRGFGYKQALIVDKGKVRPFFTANLNASRTVGGVAVAADIYTADIYIGAGPRVIVGDQGPVVDDFTAGTGLFYNNTMGPDGQRKIDGFLVTFDRPVDPATFGPNDVAVKYQDPNGGNLVDISNQVISVTPLDSNLSHSLDDFGTPPSIVLNDAIIQEPTSGSTFATLTVTMSKVLTTPTTVNFVTSDGSALSGLDYTPSTGRVTIPAGQTSATFTVPLLVNPSRKGNNFFWVGIYTIPTVAVATKSVARVTILDSKDGPTLLIGDGILKEGDTNTVSQMVFPFLLSGPASSAITLTYGTSDGTAVAGVDYTATTGSITIPAGITSGTISIPVLGNQLQENNRTFRLNLTGQFTRSEQQTIIISNPTNNPNATVTFGFQGEITTAPLPVGPLPTAAQVQNSLQSIPALAGNVTVTSSNPGTYLVTFGGGGSINSLAGLDVPLITIAASASGGGGNVVQTVKGGNTDSVILARSQATGLIVDDDDLAVTVSDVTVQENTDANAVVTFYLNGKTSNPVTITYAINTNGIIGPAASAPGDYTNPASFTVTIPAGSTSATVSIPIATDTTFEPTERFNVQVVTTTNAGVAKGTGVVTIVDNDAPTTTLYVTDLAVREGDDGANPTNAAVVIRLANATTTAVTGTLNTITGGSATGGAVAAPGVDYLTSAVPFTIAAGQTSVTVNIPITGDLDVENDETVRLTVSNVSAGVLIGRGASAQDPGIITIVDDDVHIFLADATGRESGGPLNFIAFLDSPKAVPITFTVSTTPGTATDTAQDPASPMPEEIDFLQTISRTVTIPAGQTQVNIPITIFNDDVGEITQNMANEAFTLSIDPGSITAGGGTASPTSGMIARGTAIGTIVDDDEGGNLTLSNPTILEGANGTRNLRFTVFLSQPQNGDLLLYYYTAVDPSVPLANQAVGTVVAQPGDDYVYREGPKRPPNQPAGSNIFRIVSGQTQAFVDVPINGDIAIENNEQFRLIFDDPSAGNWTRSTKTNDFGFATGTILNDDRLHAVFVNSFANEGSPLTFNGILSNPDPTAPNPGRTVTASFVDGSAVSPADYTATTGTTAANAAGAINITRATNNDTLAEGAESFTANFVGGTVAVSTPTATGTILDAQRISIIAGDFTVQEQGTDVNALIPVYLSGVPSGTVTVHYATADGAAKAGTDYTSTTGTLTFNPTDTVVANRTRQFITVPIKATGVATGNLAFTINFDTPVNAALAVRPETQTLTVTNANTIDFSFGNQTATAAGGFFGLTAADIQTALQTIIPSATVTALPNTGTAQNFLINFNNSTDVATIGIVSATNIDFFTGAVTPGVAQVSETQKGGPFATTVTIVDSGKLPILTIGAGLGLEGNAATSPINFTIVSSFPVSTPITVNVTTTDGAATAADNDYTAVTNQTVTIPAGSTSTVFAVQAKGDTKSEGNEFFTATLSGPVGASISSPVVSVDGTSIGGGKGIGTIIDEDGAPTISIGDLAVAEPSFGSSVANVTVYLSRAVNYPVSFRAASINDTALGNVNYTPLSSKFTIPAGATSFTFPVAILNDGLKKGDLQFKINLSEVSGANVADDQSIVRLQDADGGVGATLFLVRMTPQSKVGTYSYTVGPSIGDRMRTALPTQDAFENSTSGSYTPSAEYQNLSISSLQPTQSQINIQVPAGQVSRDITVTVNITYPNPGTYLYIDLIAPTGEVIGLFKPDDTPLITNVTTPLGNLFNTTFDERSGQRLITTYPPFVGHVQPAINDGLPYTTILFEAAVPIHMLYGKNPNGIWTLRVVDTSGALNTGVLKNWSLNLQTGALLPDGQKGNPMDQDQSGLGADKNRFTDAWAAPNPVNGKPFELPYQNTTSPLIIPGPHEQIFEHHYVSQESIRVPSAQYGGTGTADDQASSTIVVNDIPAGNLISDLNVTVVLDGIAGSALNITLVSPQGKRIRLAQASPFVGLTTTFDDQTGLASPLTYLLPVDALSILNGFDPNGAWTLEFETVTFPSLGALLQWRLDFAVERVAVNTTLNATDVTFDRDINVATFKPQNILRVMGPYGQLPGPFTVTPVNPHSGTVVVGGVSQPGQLARTFSIGFPTTYFLSGTYSFIFGQDTTNPDVNTNYLADALGNKLDNNLNAGLSVTRGEDPTNFEFATVTAPWTAVTSGLGQNNIIVGGRTTDFQIPVADAFLLQYLTVNLDIVTADVSNLTARLISPTNTIVDLFVKPGAFASNRANMQNVTLDDAGTTPIQLGNPPYTSGVFNPQKPLSALIGETTKGTWTLQIFNSGGNAQLRNFALNFRKSVPGTGLGEQGVDQFQTHFRIFVQDPTNALTQQVWTQVGPTAGNQADSGGASPIPGVAVDPADPSGNTVYLATANGGVWKTSNFLTNDPLGPTYVPLLDFAPISANSGHGLTIGSVGVFGRSRDPNQSIVFAGSGGNGGQGVGVMRSMDGGASWKVLDSLVNVDNFGNVLPLNSPLRDHRFVDTQIQKLVVDPTIGPNGKVILYITVWDGSAPGLYRSVDSGDTWQLMRAGKATDITLAPGSKGPTGNLSLMYAGFADEGVFITTSATTATSLTRLDGNNGVNSRVKLSPAGVYIPVPVTDPPDTPTSNAGPFIKVATPAITGSPLLDTIYQGYIYAISNNVLYASKDFGNNWTHVKLSTRVGNTGFYLYGTNDNVDVPGNNGVADFARINGISVDPQNPNIVFLQFTGNSNLNPTNIIRVDLTKVQDPYDLLQGWNQFNDGGTTFRNSQGSIVALVMGNLVSLTPDQPYGIYDPNDPVNPKHPYLNALRDPDAPFLQPTGQELIAIDHFNNSGVGARWTDYFIDINSTVNFVGAVGGGNNPFQPTIITTIDPNTGLTRVIIASIDGVYSALDDGSGKRFLTDGIAEAPVAGNRTGNIASGQLINGAAQPSILAADIAQALFYGTSHNGSFNSSSTFFGTGNIDWALQNGVARQIQTDPSGAGIVYDYVLPGPNTATVNLNLLPNDFFQVTNPGAIPISRVSGLLQAGDNPNTNVGQWPRGSGDLQYPDASSVANEIGRFANNPVDPTALVIGSRSGNIFRSNTQLTGRGIQWFQIASTADLDNTGTYVDALAFGAPSSTTASSLSDFIYGGTINGKIFVTTSGGGTGGWRNITGTGLNGTSVLSIVPNPKAGSRDVFALTTVGVFYLADSSVANPVWVRLNDVAGKDALFAKTRVIFGGTETTRAATFFTDLTADWRFAIPNASGGGTHPVLYLATDGGVFRSTDMGAKWTLFPAQIQGALADGGLLPNVLISDIDLVLGNTTPTTGFVNESTGFNMLYATTFGRSSYAIRLNNSDVEQFRAVAPFGPQVNGIAAINPDPQTTFQAIDIAFSNTIDPSTFTTADISSLIGPGNVIIPITSIEVLSASSFRVHFAPQTVTGNYTLTFGPNITDFAGNLMDQNNNHVNGEPSDFFQGTVFFVANTPPTVSSIADVNVPKDSGPQVIPFTVGDGQTPIADLRITVNSSNQTFVSNANIVLGGSGANKTLTITPAAGTFGSTVITISVTDGPGLTTASSFTFAVDNAPTLEAIPDQITIASTAASPKTLNITLVASDPDGQTLTFLTPVTAAFTSPAYTFDQNFGLTADASGTFYPDLYGPGFKWLTYKPNGAYMVILPNGELHLYSPTAANHVGALVVALDPSYNADPTKLFGLINPYPTVVQDLYGQNEKWLFNPGNLKWYAILPNGLLYQFGSPSNPFATLIANFGDGSAQSPYWVNTSLLTEPPPPANPAAGTASVAGNILTIAPPVNFVGSFNVTARVSDGFIVATRTFNVTVFNQAPTLGPIADQLAPHSSTGTPTTITIPLVGNDPDGQTLNYSPSAVALTTTAYSVDQSIGLVQASGSFFPNLFGQNERWLFYPKTGGWIAILPDGTLHPLVGGANPIGPAIATVGVDFYYNPDMLIGLTFLDSYFQNKFGLGEKYLFNPANLGYYLILPNGELHQFGSPAAPVGALVAAFPTSHYDDPTLIFEPAAPATPPSTAFSVTGNTLTITPPANFVGAFTVNLVASDGVATVARSFNVTIFDHRPTFPAVADQVVNHANGNVQIPLNPSDVDAGDVVAFTVQTVASASKTPFDTYLPANPPAGTVTVTGGTLTITPPPNFIGVFDVIVTGSDGMKSFTRSFKVTITNNAPTVDPINNVTMPAIGTTQLTVSGSDPDAGDTLSFSILDPAVAQTAFNLDNSLGLTQQNGSYFSNKFGLSEKTLFGAASGLYYLLLPNGELHQFGTTSVPVGALVASLPQSFYSNPALLHEAATPIPPNSAPTPPAPTSGTNIPSVSLVGTLLTINPNGFVGQFEIMVLASDGRDIGFRKFLVTTT